MRPLPPKRQPGCLIIGYPGRIKAVFGAKTAENLCLGFGCREGKEFCKGLILLFSQKQKTKNSNLKFVIPTKVGIQFLEFQSFPINCLSIECLDSRLRGNDESIHT
ncbi:TPA: hypothetical protein ACJ3IP_000721, partial [Neisseria meningitidis]